MSSLDLTLGELSQTGELAVGQDPANEIETEIILAVGSPPGPWPPFAVLPVLLSGHQIGVIEKIKFVSGDTVYQFRSSSGNTVFSCLSPQSVLDRLQEVLG
jgi:hypothetical protein